jgi:cysteine desulfurase/selenocysteine lyase
MDLNKIRQDFPILQRKINGKPIAYFDNACMTLKPKQVIEAMNDYYYNISACAGRSIHKLGSETTIKYEEAREKIQDFINAKESSEIIFTKNTTESINLIARSFPLTSGDVVLTTDKEHNSNLIPWHIQKKIRNIQHIVIPSKNDNSFDIERFEQMMNKKVKLVSMVHTSNLDGCTIPAQEIIKIVHDYGALVLLDSAQSVPGKSVDVQYLDVDFLVFSIHKMLGPTGLGVLYGKHQLLDELPPFIVGGNTVEESAYDSSVLLPAPEKFEAGLQNYAGAIGAGAAVDYINGIGIENIEKHGYELNKFITDNLKDLSDVEIVGPNNPKLRDSIVTLIFKNHDAHSVAMSLDDANIMCRSGVFCVHSWFKAHNIKDAVRISFYLYNTKEECKNLVEKIGELLS